jgi:hypothetical protein
MAETQSWEFLIQQDGDRAWLPIEPPLVEILEGRYRIVAKSRYKNASVNVAIKYEALEEDPPKRRIQKRKHQANPQGLMVVIPYTELRPGLWEFCCTSINSDVNHAWKHSIQLNVLPQDAGGLDDWDSIWNLALDDSDSLELPVTSTPNLATTSQATGEEIPVVAATSAEELLRQVEHVSGNLVDEVLAESLPSEVHAIQAEPAELPPLSIALVQDAYIVRQGQTLQLAGRILPTSDTERPLMLNHALFSVCLRDPQSAAILLETGETIENQLLPSDFTYHVTLPSVLDTRLIIGKLTLRDATAEDMPILASRAFTLTADAQELLDAVNALHHSEPGADSVMADEGLESQSKQVAPLNLTFLNFVQSPKSESSEHFAPAVNQPLPPKLHPSMPSGQPKRKLDLPTFVGRAADEPTQLEIPLPHITVGNTTAVSDAPPQAEGEQLEIALDAPADPIESVQADDRFLDRLNLLAEESKVSDELKALAEDVHDSSRTEEMVGVLPSPSFKIDIKPSPDPVETEFVVDDEPILPLADLVISRRQRSTTIDNTSNPFLISDTESVPIPKLFVTQDQLIAGTPFTVNVKLPDIAPKIYVKLWINDRQTRMVLQPSCWLTDFGFDGLGELEASTQLMVPMGSVEIRLEAIAVEVLTNRESRKISLDLVILPSSEPNFSVEDFEV